MKIAINILLSAIIITLLIIPSEVTAQKKLRIGTYDSRIIAITCLNSSFYKNPMQKLYDRMKAAREKGDKKEIESIEWEAGARQMFRHEQGFGTGSAMEFLDLIKDELKKLAQKEKLDLIVSKWELAFIGNEVEKGDVTLKLAGIFAPGKNIEEMAAGMMKQPPVKEAYLIRD